MPTKCTFASTSGAFVEQHWYNCATCGLVGDKGACAACIRTCHAGHDISYARKSSFFCDCGARGSTTAADRAAQRERESFLGGDIPGGRRGASAAAFSRRPPRAGGASEPPSASMPTIERRPPKQDRARLTQRKPHKTRRRPYRHSPGGVPSPRTARAAAASLAERPIRSRASSIVQTASGRAQPSYRGRTSKGNKSAAPTRSAPARRACASTADGKVRRADYWACC